jgi:hypothetical protein
MKTILIPLLITSLLFIPLVAYGFPSSIGIIADGEIRDKNYNVTPFEINTNGIAGSVQIHSISTNPPSPGASLQLNAILHVTTTNGTADYFIQNVLQIADTNYRTAYFENNVWSLSEPVNSSGICAVGNQPCYPSHDKYQQYYATSSKPFTYQLPFSTSLVMTEDVVPNHLVEISFMHIEHGNIQLYDHYYLPIPNVISASFLIKGDPSISPHYVAALVWGGNSNGSSAYFDSMDSSLNLGYKDTNSNTWKPFPDYFQYGYDSTAETAQNIYSIIYPQFPGQALVKLGNNTNQNNIPTSTTNTPQTNQPITSRSDTGFSVEYSITNGKVLGMKTDVRDSSLIVSINSVNTGTVTLQLPRPVIDAKTNSGQDDAFIIMVNGAIVQPENESANDYLRNITIPFPQGDVNIEIVGTHAASGFGTFASGIVGIQTIPGYVDFMPDPNNLPTSTMNEPQTNQPIINTPSDSQLGNMIKVDGTGLSVKYSITNGNVLDIKTMEQSSSLLFQ